MDTFINSPEDMAWLFDVHVPEWRGKARSAIIEGNEDSPSRVILYESAEPTVYESAIARVRLIGGV